MYVGNRNGTIMESTTHNIVYTNWFNNSMGCFGICVTRDKDDMPRAFISLVKGEDKHTDKEYIVEYGMKFYGSIIDEMHEAFVDKKEFQCVLDGIKSRIGILMYKDKNTGEMKSYISPVDGQSQEADRHIVAEIGAKFHQSILKDIRYHMNANY